MACTVLWNHLKVQNNVLKEVNNMLSSSSLLFCAIFYNVFELIIGTIFIVIENKPCDKPLKLWLVAHLIGEFVHMMTKLYKSKHQASNWLHMILRLHYVFSVLWLSLGTYWAFHINKESCESNLILGLIFCIILIDYVMSVIPIITVSLTLLNIQFLVDVIHCFNPKYDWQDEMKILHGLTYDVNMFNPDRNRCCVCLEKYVQPQLIRLLRCQHDFHADCVDGFLDYNGHCPICQEDIIIL